MFIFNLSTKIQQILDNVSHCRKLSNLLRLVRLHSPLITYNRLSSADDLNPCNFDVLTWRKFYALSLCFPLCFRNACHRSSRSPGEP